MKKIQWMLDKADALGMKYTLDRNASDIYIQNEFLFIIFNIYEKTAPKIKLNSAIPIYPKSAYTSRIYDEPNPCPEMNHCGSYVYASLWSSLLA